MKRIPIVLALLLVVAVCGITAWFALQDVDVASTPPEAAETEDGVDETATEPESDSARTAKAAESGRKRVSVAADAENAAASAVVGRIVYEDVGVAGARIEAYAAPEGEFDERLARAREIFGDLFTEEELKGLEGRFGGRRTRSRVSVTASNDEASADEPSADEQRPASGGSVSISVGSRDGVQVNGELADIDLESDDAQDAMGAGMEMAGRMFSDPSFLEKAMDVGRLETAGFERDADWPRVGVATTDAEGRFRIEDLPDGNVELRVRASGYVRQKQRVDVGSTDVAIDMHKGALLEGVVVSGGQPIAGASVRTKTATLTTDGTGGFRLDGARTPRESLLVSAPGFVTAGVSVPLTLNADGQASSGQSTNELVTVELERAAIIRGVVLSNDGAPLAGATVRVTKGSSGFNPMAFMELAQRNNVKPPRVSVETDANGMFEIDGIPGGTVKLAAEMAGFLTEVTDSLTVTAGESTVGVELRLTRESTVTGRVIGPDGAPVANATVKVALDKPKGMGAMIAGMFGGSWARGTTADDGTYTVGGLRSGERKVRVETKLYLHAEATAVVPDEASVAQDFTLRPGYTVLGRVLSPTGDPVGGARVGVKWATAKSTGNPMAAMMGGMSGPDARVTADDEGRFEFTGLQDGPYDLTASSDAHLDGTLDEVVAGATEITVQLRAAASIAGRVVDVDGNPVPGAWVHRKGGPKKKGANPFMAMLSQGPKVLTDADGNFVLPKLEPGRYQLFSRRESYAESETQKIELAEGEKVKDVELMLRVGETISGTVVTRGDGGAVEGALVYVTPGAALNFNPMDAVDMDPRAPANSISTKTDAQGGFTLKGLTPGNVTIEVRHSDFAPASLARIAVPGTDVVIEIGTGGVVEGVVTDKSGNAQSGTSIILSGGAMGFGRTKTASTDANGFYRMERVVPGSYNIMKMGGDAMFGMDGMAPIVVREGETTVKDFRAKAGGGSGVRGGVMRDGKPLEGAMVVLSGGSVGMKMASSAADGSFTFEDVPAGTYTVSVQADLMGGGTSTQEIVIDEDGNSSDVQLELTSLSLEGRVIDGETGDGVGFAQVVLFDPAGGAMTSIEEIMRNQRGQAMTDEKGRFTITGVAKGTFSMRVSADGYAEATQDGVSAGAAGIVVRLTRGVEFEVTVLGPDNEPVTGATVTARDAASGRETSAIGMGALRSATDTAGVATLRLSPGSYTIVAESAAWPTGTADVDTARGSVIIRLERGGAIDVTVRKDGRPLAGARVRVLDEAGQEIAPRVSMSNFMGSGLTTDSAGRAVREGLPEGRLTVVVTLADGTTEKQVVEVRRGATATITIDAQ